MLDKEVGVRDGLSILNLLRARMLSESSSVVAAGCAVVAITTSMANTLTYNERIKLNSAGVKNRIVYVVGRTANESRCGQPTREQAVAMARLGEAKVGRCDDRKVGRSI